MSEARRAELRDEAFAELLEYPTLGLRSWVPRAPVKSSEVGAAWSSWRFFAYSYCRAFGLLWDAGYSSIPRIPNPNPNYYSGGSLNYPLLFVCRHSIELWLKAALSSVPQMDQTNPATIHGLSRLWSGLMDALAHHTGDRPDLMDGDLAGKVQNLIRMLDAHDSKGDRFRYPTKKNSESYAPTASDLEELYRVHAFITGFCDAVCTQMEVEAEAEDG